MRGIKPPKRCIRKNFLITIFAAIRKSISWDIYIITIYIDKIIIKHYAIHRKRVSDVVKWKSKTLLDSYILWNKYYASDNLSVPYDKK